MAGAAESKPSGTRLSVVAVIGSLDVGGSERHIVDTFSRLDSDRFSPRVYLFGNRGPLAETAEQRGLTIVEGPMTRRSFDWLPRPFRGGLTLAVSLAHLAWFLNRARPDICHCFLPLSCILGAMAARLARLRGMVASRRSLNNYQHGRPLTTRVERLAMRSMRLVMVNSAAIQAQLVGEGVAPERIRIIYNGLDLDRLRCGEGRQETRAALGIPEAALVIIVVANLIPYKGHADLLDGLAGVADALPADWRLLCVGRDDGIGAALTARAAEAGIGDKVELLGMRMDVGCLFQAADIAVSCSHQEGFSNSIIEAMACSLPVVATNVGGSAEAVTDGVTGLVVEPGQPAELGAAVLSLAQDDTRRAAFGAAGLDKAAREYALDEVVRRYEESYRAVAAATGSNNGSRAGA